MADKPTIDPLSVMRELAAVWNKVVPPTPPIESETPAGRMMAQALAAANMPSREDIADLAARLDRIEESLARMERRQEELAQRRKRKPKV